jgi:hypothetical protein
MTIASVPRGCSKASGRLSDGSRASVGRFTCAIAAPLSLYGRAASYHAMRLALLTSAVFKADPTRHNLAHRRGSPDTFGTVDALAPCLAWAALPIMAHVLMTVLKGSG